MGRSRATWPILLCTDMHQSNVMAMMVSLQRRLDHHVDGDQEQKFFSHALQYLTTSSGRQVEIQDWMITSYEVEFGPQIGSGGLYVFLGRGRLSWCAPLILNPQQRTGFQGDME